MDNDAAEAAAIVLASEDLGDPKTADGPAEMVRILRVARASAVRARGKAFLATQRPHRHRPRRATCRPVRDLPQNPGLRLSDADYSRNALYAN